MKQIFDWLREQIYKDFRTIPLQNNRGVKFKVIDVKDVENIIDEAEAKWEQDCCEWVCFKDNDKCLCKCDENNWFIDKSLKFKYCPYCGKRIKISEVE